MKEQKKRKNGKYVGVIALGVISLIFTLIVHLKLNKLGVMDSMTESIWGYIAILVAVFIGTYVLFYSYGSYSAASERNKKNPSEEEKNRKNHWAQLLILFIDAFMTGLFVFRSRGQLSSIHPLYAIAEVAAFFAIVWIGFEFFMRFKFFPEKIYKFVVQFLTLICAPMVFLIVPMMGAFQIKYGYVDLLKPTFQASADVFAESMRGAFLNIVGGLYYVGQHNPDLWIWLPIVAFIVSTILLLIKTFTPPKLTDEEKSAQQLLVEACIEDDEEQSYITGQRPRPPLNALMEKILTSNKEIEERERQRKIEAGWKYNIYNVKFIKMKGGSKKNGKI